MPQWFESLGSVPFGEMFLVATGLLLMVGRWEWLPGVSPTDFEVSPGQHTLLVRGRRFIGEASNPLEVDLAPGSTRAFECRTKSRLGSLTDKEAQAIERREFHWVRLYET